MTGNEVYLLSRPARPFAPATLWLTTRCVLTAILLTALAVSTNYNHSPLLIIIEMTLKAVLLVEVVGYAYHRFFQHLGIFTRLGGSFNVIRRNQKYHWNHHNIRYPAGKFYKRNVVYSASEQGVAWGWVLPGLAIAAVYMLYHGLNWPSLCFVFALAAYAKLVVSRAHERFHEGLNQKRNSPYFRWLDQIHLLHHFDQRCNFTIVHPLMDIIFGTYMSPAQHEEQLSMAIDEEKALVSDVINWTYMLTEASPTEYAVFVSDVHKHSRLRKKLKQVLDVFAARLAVVPQDQEARILQKRALELYNEATVLSRA